MSEFKIETYSDEVAPALAKMWNESDDQWPGTFTRGVPMTAKRIKKWMGEVDYMLNLVVKNGNDKVVAYGNLRDTPNQSGVSCYVPLLNVHPDYQGKSLCRRMLNQMVDLATEKGYKRMTIGTWSGNLKSVPLYKKVGFFWTPGIAVHMENFTPAVRQLPFAKKFFEKADWYRDFTRELNQTEDKMRHPKTGDMEVYICRWDKGDDFLEAVIDRNGQSITGVETPVFAAHAVVDNSNPAQGFRYGISWCLENRTNAPMTISLMATADEGIDVTYESEVTLAPGEKRRLESSFVCTVDAPAIDMDEKWEALPRPHIHTHIKTDAFEFALGTGLSYRPAIEISVEPDVISLLPMQERNVLVQMRNRVKRPFYGKLTIQPNSDLVTSWETHEFEIDADGFAAIPLTVSSLLAGGSVLTIAAELPDGTESVQTSPAKTAVLCAPLGSIAAVEAGDKAYVENDSFLATIFKKGGRVKVWDKVGNKDQMFFREEIGPPFNPHDLEQKEYDITLKQQNGQVTAVFEVKSTRFAGLAIRREVLFTAAPIMQITHHITNKGMDDATFTVMTRLGMNDTNHGNGRSYIPYPNRLVSDITSKYPVHTDDFPEEPEKITEQWAAHEVDGQIHGVVWNKASKQSVRWGLADIHSREVTLTLGQNVTLEPIHPYCGSGSWQDVRRVWQRISNHQDKHQPTPQAPIELDLQPSPVLTLNNNVNVTLQATNIRKMTLQGDVTLKMPENWSANQTSFIIDELAQNETFIEPIAIATPAAIGPTKATLHLETASFNESFEVPMIRMGDASKSVEVLLGDGDNGQSLLTMRNGQCAWVLAPDYHAGVVAWRDGIGENHLVCKYPDPQATFSEFTPFHGGIQPMLPHRESGDWLGKLYEETFTYSTIDAPDAKGLPWRGVQLVSRLEREAFLGLRAEIEYLTLPGSNVLKTVFRMVNETAVYRFAQLRFQDYFQVDGAFENTTMVDQEHMRKRVKEDYWEFHPSPWMAAVNPETGRCIVTVKASGRRELFLHDLGPFGGHIWALDAINIPPHGAHELVVYLALADSLAIGMQYAALAK
jgi:GNAT superfamily N-acetyltransferase